MGDDFDFKKIEEKWLKRWQEENVFDANVEDTSKPKYYNLCMFPYPSSASLHVGHAYTYSGVDAHGRFRRLMGDNVFQPMGFDAFGIHGENFAIKVNRHPRDVLEENVANFRRQMEALGTSFDWSHTINTTYPDYYKWTQWLFVQLYKHGLVERKSAEVNWCPSCKTVLADEQVIKGKCERCSTVTEKKEMLQWFFKITQYTERLLKESDELDWPKRILSLQKNWIGKSDGASIAFDVEKEGGDKLNENIEVYTTRPDTLFGATFIVVSIKHEILKKVGDEYYEKVDKFVKRAESQTAVENQKDKEGQFSGLYGINPINGEKIPVYVANYVLSNYGTGALMGVPAHDQKDFEFAKKYGIEIKRVIKSDTDLPYENEGALLDSDKYSGIDSQQAREQIVKDLGKIGKGDFKTEYKLRDWLVSRQRYWGPPIPIIYCDECGVTTVPEEDLPVFLPNLEDFQPKGDGKSPLAGIDSFVNTTCPKCGKKARRETDVLDNFVDSSWYFLRYPSVGINDVPFDEELTKRWLPTDIYIGGAEHAVLHLLYCRFIVMFLKDYGYLSIDKPFKKLRNNGHILKDGSKMSKSKGNVVNPDEYISKYGTDVLRIYLLFIGPFSIGGNFSDKNILGIVRFIERVWKMKDLKAGTKNDADDSYLSELVNKISDDLDNLRFNTAISYLMEYSNWVYKNYKKLDEKSLLKIENNFIIMLSVFAPFISEEIWELLRNKGFVFNAKWPEISKIKRENMSLPVQVNGKVRGVIEIKMNASEKDAISLALEDDKIKKFIESGKYRKVVFVKNKILNIIV